MVGQIPSCAIPSQKATRQVSILRQNYVPLLVEELENVVSVVVLGRIAVLRRQTIVHRHHDGGDLARETPANLVVDPDIGGKIDEAAAVEEHKHREFGGGIGRARDEKADPEVARGVEGEVGGFDALAGFGVGRYPEAAQGLRHGEETAVDGAVGAGGDIGDGVEKEEGDAGLEGEQRFQLLVIHSSSTSNNCISSQLQLNYRE